MCFNERDDEALELLTQRLSTDFELDKPPARRARELHFVLLSFDADDEVEPCPPLPSYLPAFTGSPPLVRLIIEYAGKPLPQPVSAKQLLETQKLLRCPAPIRVNLDSLDSVQEVRNAIGCLVSGERAVAKKAGCACCVQ